MTLKEYLEDYASEETRRKGEALIERELTKVPNEKVRHIAEENLVKIGEGKRDFRF
jgi:2-iminoacetate synthase